MTAQSGLAPSACERGGLSVRILSKLRQVKFVAKPVLRLWRGKAMGYRVRCANGLIGGLEPATDVPAGYER